MQQINRRIAASAISGKAVVRNAALARRIAIILCRNRQRKNQNVMTARMVAIIRALDGVRKRFSARITAKKQIRSVRTMKCKEITCGERKKFCRECEYHQPTWKYRFCNFTTCPYRIRDSTFRKKPLRRDFFHWKEVVGMNGL